MPDMVLILRSSAVAALVAAITVLLSGWPWRRPRPSWTAAGGALGVGAGFFVAACLLGLAPRFPPQEDRDRLLLILLPAVVVAEVAAGFFCRPPWLGWLFRVIVATGAARALLHGSVYITDVAGPGSSEWSPQQTWLILGGMAAALTATWALLDRLAHQRASCTVPLSLALAAAGAGLTVMLSGYASGGQLGIPLAAALAGAAVASLVLASAGIDARGALGVGVVGLFSLLVVGRFFGSLTTINALVLFAAPLLAWGSELVSARRVGPLVRNLARVAAVMAPVAIVLTLAVQKFNADSVRTTSSPSANEPTIEDYLNFRK